MKISRRGADLEPNCALGMPRLVVDSELFVPMVSTSGLSKRDTPKNTSSIATPAQAAPRGATPAQANARALSIEMLRMAAIYGIAVFHTFKPWFEAICEGKNWISTTGLAPIGHVFPYVVAILGCIDQLGAWGNHVFIMISGYFLLPRAIKAAQAAQKSRRKRSSQTQLSETIPRRYWAEQYKSSLARAKVILITVALYAVCALCTGMCAPKLTYARFDDADWLLRGLQFIWVYLALVMLCPLIGWIWSHTKHPTVVLLLLVLVVYMLNLYIALVSPGEDTHNLWEWRKFMSAITYGTSFVVGGWIGGRIRAGAYRHGTAILALTIITTCMTEIFVSYKGTVANVDALSHKSTSPFAFALAVAALLCALSYPLDRAARYPNLSRAISHLVSGTLGFYILESFFSRGWHQVGKSLLKLVATDGFVPFLVVGCLFSAGFLILLLIVDSTFRRPCVRWITRCKT